MIPFVNPKIPQDVFRFNLASATMHYMI